MGNGDFVADYYHIYSQVDKCNYWGRKAIDEGNLEEASGLIFNTGLLLKSHEKLFRKRGPCGMSVDHRRRIDSLWRKMGFIETKLEKAKQ